MGDWNYNRFSNYQSHGNNRNDNYRQPFYNQPAYDNSSFGTNQYVNFQQFLNQYNNPNIVYQPQQQQQQHPVASNQGQNYGQHRGEVQYDYNPRAQGAHSNEAAMMAEIASTKSNLTATAQEFVPKSSRQIQPNIPNPVEERPGRSNDQSNSKKVTSPTKSSSKNADKTFTVTNWRDRDDDTETDNTHISSVVFESNRSNKGNNPRSTNESARQKKNTQSGSKADFSGRYGAGSSRKESDNQGGRQSDRTNSHSNHESNEFDDRRKSQRSHNGKENFRGGNRSQRSFYDNEPPADSRNARSLRSTNTDGESYSYGQGRSFRPNSDYYNSDVSKNSRSQSSNSDYQDNDVDVKYNRSKLHLSNDNYKQKSYSHRSDDHFGSKNDYDHGRNYGRNNFSNPSFKKKDMSPIKDIDGVEVSQRERLTEQLNKGILECLVCCERIKQADSVWSCSNCFHVLHLDCIIRWAKSSMTEGTWRCPACQNNSTLIPNKYVCFCGKLSNPEWVRGGDSAHTCGDICGRLPPSCLRHPCTLLCHPGPCPQCDAVVQKKCECGATSQSLRCSHTQPLLCDQVCNKMLNCKTHRCEDVCHAGDCKSCKVTVEQQCYCPKQVKRSLPCDVDTIGVSTFSCGEVCDRKLECANHNCTQICHEGQCDKCQLLPEFVKRCPCGQTLLSAEQSRTSCLDPIPVCNKICSKQFTCGPADAKHKCKKPCHTGDCPPCPDKTIVPCRCASINSPILCINLEKDKDNVRCKRKCSKKQSCVRHRCKTLCCIDIEHRCPLPCNRSLTCGLHRCEDTCHSGHCDTCWRTSFDELRCRCGAAVRYPPVPCGTRPPHCSRPCSLQRPCGHEPFHDCHPEPSTCPPCTVLTQKYCYGRHKMRKTIPCHQEEFSCGLPCGKDLPCQKHKCIETCHKGNCPTVCTQQCEVERLSCSHPCGAACGHAEPCPVRAPCKRPVNVSCLCSRRTAVKMCADHMRDLHRLQAAAGMLEGTMGQPVDIKELIAKGNTTTTLDCDDECYVEERNRRMAIGLQIRNPDVSSKLMPRYSDTMKQYFARDENFCIKVHEKLTELVLLAQKSKQKTRSHSFQPMNHAKRQFLHEYCEHFGCESKAYDSEPYRNIVATAYREKSWLPALSLMEVVRRDKGQRRIPGPVVGSANSTTASTLPKSSSSSGGAWSTLVANSNTGTSESTRLVSSLSGDPGLVTEPPRRPKIDYFDAPPED